MQKEFQTINTHKSRNFDRKFRRIYALIYYIVTMFTINSPAQKKTGLIFSLASMFKIQLKTFFIMGGYRTVIFPFCLWPESFRSHWRFHNILWCNGKKNGQKLSCQKLNSPQTNEKRALAKNKFLFGVSNEKNIK